jgi:hypothetical protein
MSTSPSKTVDDFDDYDFSRFEENPSWLVADIASMVASKKTKYKPEVISDKDPVAKMAREIRHMKSKLQPDKNDSYSNFKQEKAATTRHSDMNEVRLRKTRLGDQESRLDEAVIQGFLSIVQQQNKDKARRHEEYMQRSLYRPNPATLPSLPRRWSPTRPRPQVNAPTTTLSPSLSHYLTRSLPSFSQCPRPVLRPPTPPPLPPPSSDRCRRPRPTAPRRPASTSRR